MTTVVSSGDLPVIAFLVGPGMNAEPPRVISSPSTFFVKFVMGPALLLVYGAAATFLIRTGDFIAWGGAAVMIVVATFFCSQLLSRKRVAIDADSICVSNFVKEIRVPLTEVLTVRAGHFDRTIVAVEFLKTTDFGRSICFMPRFDLVWTLCLALKTHPVIEELRSGASQARIARALADERKRAGSS